ncbi:hypothetical protein [Klebsiella pneumoniae]|uniref:hypothetical protein n=1 Tax=Klebsiella pneumoniae TaxID=573 RepID=UPI0018E001AF|nr:hypothetical protein [Klebsiella pneumoniae]
MQASENTSVGFITMNPHFIFGITATVRKYESVVTQEIFMGIKPGQADAESTGKEDKRRRVTPETSQSIPD